MYSLKIPKTHKNHLQFSNFKFLQFENEDGFNGVKLMWVGVYMIWVGLIRIG